MDNPGVNSLQRPLASLIDRFSDLIQAVRTDRDSGAITGKPDALLAALDSLDGTIRELLDAYKAAGGGDDQIVEDMFIEQWDEREREMGWDM